MPNLYKWSGPVSESGQGRFEAGGMVGWEMQGSGADEQLMVYETQHVHMEAV